jgi:hypothetical protein
MTTELATIEQPGSAAGTHALAMLTDEDFKLRLESLKQGRERIAEIQRRLMRPGVDFGKIPGTGDRPTLLKPGAEKLADFYQLAAGMAADMTPGDGERTPLIRYEVRCTLHLRTLDGPVVASGWGVCTSHEKKYRYRNEWTNGKKQRVVNEDPWEQANTILKIAEKRAFIDAVLRATASSGLFTQDVGDDDLPAEPVRVEPNPAPELPDRASVLREALRERAASRSISAADLDFIALEAMGDTVDQLDVDALTAFGKDLVAGKFDRQPIESQPIGAATQESEPDVVDGGSVEVGSEAGSRLANPTPPDEQPEVERAVAPSGVAPAADVPLASAAGDLIAQIEAQTGGTEIPPKPGTPEYKALPDGNARAQAKAYWDAKEPPAPKGARETPEPEPIAMGLTS